MKTIDEILEQCNPREEDGHAYYWHGDAVKAAELYAQQFKEENSRLLEEKAKLIEENKQNIYSCVDGCMNPVKKKRPEPEESQKELLDAFLNKLYEYTKETKSAGLSPEDSKESVFEVLSTEFTIQRKK